jgi:hypothetical protein
MRFTFAIEQQDEPRSVAHFHRVTCERAAVQARVVVLPNQTDSN